MRSDTAAGTTSHTLEDLYDTHLLVSKQWRHKPLNNSSRWLKTVHTWLEQVNITACVLLSRCDKELMLHYITLLELFRAA